MTSQSSFLKVEMEAINPTHNKPSHKKIGNRRKGREAALQMLYLCDNCKLPKEDTLVFFWQGFKEPSNQLITSFANELFNGITDNKDFIDDFIIKKAKNWKMDRMAVIDRNILRLATYEIIYMHQTPLNVIIDEAVEIAKTFSTQESGKFVNGILDKLKTARQPKEETPQKDTDNPS